MTILLDVDGVLVTGPVEGGFWADTLERDLGLTPDLLRNRFFEPHWEAIVTGRAELMPVLKTALDGTGITAEALRAYWFEKDSAIDMCLLDQVDALRRSGRAVWLATNQEHQRAAYLMSDLALSDHFDGMIYSAAVGCKKPAQAFFKACFAATGELSSAHVLVDDTLENVMSARNAGAGAVQWHSGMTLADCLP